MEAEKYIEHYTADDYRQWEGDWELIYGQAYAMAPSPVFDHQYITGKIFRILDEALEECPQCHAVLEMDWEVAEETVVRPDLMVICYEPGDRLSKRPEMIFEVISPSTARRDETLKFHLYEEEGVPCYTLVYPQLPKAKVYRLEDHRYRKVGDFSDESYSFKLQECTIDFDFSRLWRR